MSAASSGMPMVGIPGNSPSGRITRLTSGPLSHDSETFWRPPCQPLPRIATASNRVCSHVYRDLCIRGNRNASDTVDRRNSPRHPPARTVRSHITSMRSENIEPYQDMDKISKCDIYGIDMAYSASTIRGKWARAVPTSPEQVTIIAGRAVLGCATGTEGLAPRLHPTFRPRDFACG